jgi:GH15 family glucan-1,4-alpha-glucosidase
MCWVAFDRGIRAVERFRLDGPAERWRAVSDDIHREICERAWDHERNTFTQSYGSSELDAALLMIPMVGFLPARDTRVIGTITAIQRGLTVDGFVERYASSRASAIDGVPGREGTFLLCTFWLADALALAGRTEDAIAIFERLVGLTNDVGLLSEQYDPRTGKMVGNFPQAFSHVGLVNTALNLSGGPAPATERQTRDRGRRGEALTESR